MAIRPLEGFRVLSIALNLPGPVAVTRMAELGAEVVKIEPPTGDPFSFAQPDAYATLHQGLDVRRADLKAAEGQELLATLLDRTDVLITSSRLAALDRLGLGWGTLAEKYPSLCHVAIIGNAPPDENHPGHDLTYQAQFGLVSPPEMPRTTLADLGGALEAVSATLGLLLRRSQKEGLVPEERLVQVSLAETAEYFAQTLRWGLTSSGGVLGGGLASYNIYQCETGWIALAALEPHFWARLGSAIEQDNPSHSDLAALFRTKPAEEWQKWAQQLDLPLVAILS